MGIGPFCACVHGAYGDKRMLCLCACMVLWAHAHSVPVYLASWACIVSVFGTVDTGPFCASV